MPKIKILHILYSLNIGGLENGVVNLINESDETIFDHEICCITKSGKAEINLTKKQINIYEMDKQEGNDWHLIPKLMRLIRTRRPAIIHTRNWGTVDGIIAAKLTRTPVVVIHGEHGWNMDDPKGQNIKRRLARKILSLMVNRYIVVSENIKEWLIQSAGIKPNQISKIGNGVDANKFCPGNKERAKASLNLKDEIVIGTVGRLDPIKRQDLLLQAFSKLDHCCFNLRLIIVGDGPERTRLESLRQELPNSERIMLLGEQVSVHELYKLMDIFILPSRNEGMSNTILQAMATGLPVIATAIGGNPELVTQEKTGLLIPIDCCESIQQAINYYLHNPEKKECHGINGRARVECHFSLSGMVNQYEELYKYLYFQH